MIAQDFNNHNNDLVIDDIDTNNKESGMTSEISPMTTIAVSSIGLAVLLTVLIYLAQKDNELNNLTQQLEAKNAMIETLKNDNDTMRKRVQELSDMNDKVNLDLTNTVETVKGLKNQDYELNNLRQQLEAKNAMIETVTVKLTKTVQELKNLKDETSVMDYKTSIVNSNYNETKELETKLVENDFYYQKKNAIIHEISSYEKVIEDTRGIVFNYIYNELDIEEEEDKK